MMKLVLFGGVAFVLGLGGSTGVLVMRAPARPAGADSLAVAHVAPAEPAKAPAKSQPPAASAAHDTVAATHVLPDAAVHPAGPPVEAQAAAERPRETVVRPREVPGVGNFPPANAPDPESYKQVGNILMNMKAVEAAKILAYLSDAHVEGLLRSMSPRNAASLLSQLPSERAAALSKRLLVPVPREDK
jgi:hypothetical protein